MKFTGRTADIGIANEATRGTAEASADFWLPKLSMSYDDGIEQILDESSIGVIEDSNNAVIVGKFGEGEIEGNIYDRSFGTLLLATFGATSKTGPAETSDITLSHDLYTDLLNINLL